MFSAASMIPGPWNLSGDSSWPILEWTGGPGAKVIGFNTAVGALRQFSPGAATVVNTGGKVLGGASLLASLWATYENLHAYLDGPTLGPFSGGNFDCKCEDQ